MSRAQNDFVQDYAAKRAAQMERAKALRDQRKAESSTRSGGNQTPPLGGGRGGAPPQQSDLGARRGDGYGSGSYNSEQQQNYGSGSYDMPGAVRQDSDYQPNNYGSRAGARQPQQAPQQPPSNGGGGYGYAQHAQAEEDYPPPLTNTRSPAQVKSSQSSLPAVGTRTSAVQPPNSGTASVEVTESDFQRAVAMGIISADQARQLWSSLASGNPPPPPMPMNYGGGGGGASNPLQPKQYATLGGGESPSSYQASRFNPNQQQQDDYGDQDDDRYYEEQPKQQPSRTSGVKPKPKKNAKPEWNSDPDPIYSDAPAEEEYTAPSTRTRQTKATAARKPVQQREWNSEFTDENSIASNPAPVREEKQRVAPNRASGSRQSQQRQPAQQQFEEDPKPVTPLSLQPRQGQQGGGGGSRASQQPSRGQQRQEPPPVAQPPMGISDEVEEMERQKREAAERLEAELNNVNANEPQSSCHICGRNFRVSILSKHEAACAKANKKRKEFNMANQRADGVEGLKEAQKEAKREAKYTSKQAPAKAAGGKMPKWKMQSAQLQAAMAAARGSTGGGGAGGPPAPMPAEIDNRVPCPHCGRKFNEDVADRHIPKCKTTQAKPTMLMRKR